MSRNSGRLRGKRVLVTGSGTGIGSGIALEFAHQGADVVVHFSHNGKGARGVAKEIRAVGRRSTAFKTDFDRLDEVVELGERAVAFLGGIDILVNNSGICLNKPFLEAKPEWFDLLYHVNIRAQYFLTQRIVRDVLLRGAGAVCNITSIHGLSGAPEHSIYAGTKGAIIAYTRALGVELAHKGIRVNAIAPGWVNVEGYYQAVPGFNEKEAAKAAMDKVPRGPRRQKIRHRQARRLPLLRGRRLHSRPDDRLRRGHLFTHVADLRFQKSIHREMGDRLCAGHLRILG